MTFHKFRKQNGVVLLSCLVFLLLILALVRFTMNSSKLELEKVSADIEAASAREYAMMALRDAERDIQGKNLNDIACGIATSRPTTCADSRVAGTITVADSSNLTEDELAELKEQANDALEVAKGVAGSGVLNEQAQNNCGAPVWQCVNWDAIAYHGAKQAGAAGTQYNPINYGERTGAQFNIANTTPPQYIIEIIDGNEFGQPDRTAARITAIGYGQGGDDQAAANVMLQANYVIK